MLREIAHFLASHAIAMLVLAAGLRTGRALARDLASDWRFLARALLIVWLAVPLLALAVLGITRPAWPAAVTLMVLAVCPGVPMVIRRARRMHGDARTTLLLLIATALTAIALLPAWTAVLARVADYELAIEARQVAAVVAPTVLVPFAIGRIVNVAAPRAAARLAKLADVLFIAGVVILVAAIVIERIPALGDLGWREVIAGLLIPAGAALLGYAWTRAPRTRRVSVGYAAALGNPMLAVSVMASSYGLHALPLVLAFVVLRAAALIPFSRWLVRRE